MRQIEGGCVFHKEQRTTPQMGVTLLCCSVIAVAIAGLLIKRMDFGTGFDVVEGKGSRIGNYFIASFLYYASMATIAACIINEVGTLLWNLFIKRSRQGAIMPVLILVSATMQAIMSRSYTIASFDNSYSYVAGMRKAMEQRVDIDSIRTWARRFAASEAERIRQSSVLASTQVELSMIDDLPESIHSLLPAEGFIRVSNEGLYLLRLFYVHGVFEVSGALGIDVWGSAKESDFFEVRDHVGSVTFFRHQWQPGVYLWDTRLDPHLRDFRRQGVRDVGGLPE